MPPEPSRHLAIDFGTSNTTAAYRLDNQRPVVLQLSSAGNLLPSAVFVDDDGTISTGQRAVNSASLDVTRFEAAPKRQLDFGEVLMGGREWPVTDLVAAVLRHVLTTARKRVGGEFDTVVLTHPQAWEDTLKNRLRESGLKAGINERQLGLVPEPEAAARFYSHLYPAELPANGRVCVFDLGAGTLDIAVLEKRGDDFALLTADGDPALGGLTFDEHIRRWLGREVQDSPDLVAATDKPNKRAELMDSIRKAKEDLTDNPWAKFPIPGMAEAERGWVMLRQHQFNNLIANDVARAVDLTKRTLERAAATDAGSVLLYLTGGASSVPLVQDRLSQAKLGRIERIDDPKTVVAAGALLVPGALKPGIGAKPPPGRTGHVIYAPPLPTTGYVQRVHKTQGDAVRANEPLFDVTAGNALYAIYAPVSGWFVHQNLNVGYAVSASDYLGVIGDADLTMSDRAQLPRTTALHRELSSERPQWPPPQIAPPPQPQAPPQPLRPQPQTSTQPHAVPTPNPTRPSDSKANMAVLLALLGLFTCGVTSIFGLVVGFSAKKQIDASNGAVGGRKKAITAIAIGLFVVAIYVVLGVSWLTSRSGG